MRGEERVGKEKMEEMVVEWRREERRGWKWMMGEERRRMEIEDGGLIINLVNVIGQKGDNNRLK